MLKISSTNKFIGINPFQTVRHPVCSKQPDRSNAGPDSRIPISLAKIQIKP
jgi:hypothetical protein